eukprot:TRINITY_DN8328_c0_g3_i1.p1 TRINITY_DN8328_c0_g3~~TRINITY_DN8328_c0_g3_i1.p1  ORF type:complete len:438 (-),score=60.65 TRINITY_DN8328_c0_g3_i1:68-1381(-)
MAETEDPFSSRRNTHKECRPLASAYLSRFFPSFLEIRATPNKGNVVVAGKEFLPGETLFQSTPFGAVVSSGYHTSVCQNCVSLISSVPNAKPTSCERCEEIWYCSETCLKQDLLCHGDGAIGTECGFWLLLHTCKELYEATKHYDPDISTCIRLLVRIFAISLNRRKGESLESDIEAGCDGYWLRGATNREPVTTQLEDVLCLSTNRNLFDEEKAKAFEEVRSFMCKLWQKEDGYDDPSRGILHQTSDNIEHFSELVSDLIDIIASNGFNVTGSESLDIVVGVFPSISLLNHSCQPNVEYTKDMITIYEGDENSPEVEKKSRKVVSLRVRALRTIKQGEEVCTSYIPLYMFADHLERREKLRKGWCFECDCPSCSNNFYLRDQEWRTFASTYFCSNPKGCFGLKIPEFECGENVFGVGKIVRYVCSHCGLTLQLGEP